ncbi:MAG: hypothetical protein LC789_13365 [Actinobacteria bacterium]|nr:hypothetical protein [Actinomycetota bacterium]MCA1721156.1 hypothetical protein [Actinomycetota bacterium]
MTVTPAPNAPSTEDPRQTAAALVNALSEQRLRPYIAAAGTVPGALALHRWNTAVSAAFFEVLSAVEVTARNAVEQGLRDLGAGGRWWEQPWWLADAHRRDELARGAARAHGPDMSGDLLARLPFGFWAELLAPRNEQDLWPVLARQFPHHHGAPGPLHDALRRLGRVRNKIAHHAAVHAEDLGALHDDALDVIGAVCPVTRAWTASTSRVPALLARRPGS